MKNESMTNFSYNSRIDNYGQINKKDNHLSRKRNKENISSKTNKSKQAVQSKYFMDKLIFENKMLQKKKNNKYSYLKNNIYLNNSPDFKELAKDFPMFAKYVYQNKYGGYSIKWNNKDALKELNRCLLKNDFDIDYWDIPDGFLIPTITSRLNYICWIKSLLDDFLYKENSEEINSNVLSLKNKKLNYQKKFLNNLDKSLKNTKNIFQAILKEEQEEKITITGLDIGTGANCIYPLLGYGMYKWHFKASDINTDSIECANKIIAENNLEGLISIEKQNNEKFVFYSVVKPQEIFYFCMSNPPYFDFSEEKSDNPHTVN